MITYWIDSDILEEREHLRWTFFELGLRVGIPFHIRFGLPEEEDRPAFVYGSGQAGTLRQRPIRGEFAERDGLWVSLADNDRDPIFGCAMLLGFAHEKDAVNGYLDRFRRIVPPYRDLPNQPNPKIGYLERTADWLRSKIAKRWNLPYTLPWDGASVAILTHDCDGPSLHNPYEIGRAFFKAVTTRSTKELEAALVGLWTWLLGRPDPFWNFENWSAREAIHHGHSTFFIYAGRSSLNRAHFHDPRYNPASLKFRETLHKLVESGWEVGLHSGIGAYDADSLLCQKRTLEEVTGRPITSCRGHYWSFDWMNPKSFWRALQQAGFTADASLCPLRLGLRNGSNLPVMPFRYSSETVETPLLVFPTQVMDAYLRDAMAENKAAAESYLRTLVAPGLSLTTDWHVRTYSGVGLWKGFDRLYATLEELCLDRRAKMMSLQQAERLWRERILLLDLDLYRHA